MSQVPPTTSDAPSTDTAHTHTLYSNVVHVNQRDALDLSLSVERSVVAVSAVTLSVERQEKHLACKKLSDEVLAWLSVWNEV